MAHSFSNESSIVVFDLDGTLSKSKEKISPEMAVLLDSLLLKKKVIVISGGSIDQYKKQLLPFVKPSINLILLPLEGSERFEYSKEKNEWVMTFKKVFPHDIKKDVINLFNKIIKSEEYNIPKIHDGAYIEDRETEVAFSALGQNASLIEKENWDKDHKKRQKVKKVFEEEIPNVNVTIAGTTTIEVLPKGWDKATGLTYYLKEIGMDIKEVVFIGDAIYPGGNDYPIKQLNVRSFKVNGPEDTVKVIEKLIIEDNRKYKNNPVAYFSMEYAMDNNVETYAGGLGILCGDFLLQAAENRFPIVAFGLKYGDILPKSFSIVKDGDGDLLVDIPLGEDNVKAKVWQKDIDKEGIVKLYLIDTNIEENNNENKKITHNLYDPVFYSRLKQQIVLGIGAIRVIKKLSIKPSIYHLNEGHTAFAGLAIYSELAEGERNKIVASKHTILPEAGLFIHSNDFKNVLNKYCQENKKDINDFFEKGKYEGDTDLFSTTKFLMNIAVRANGVSKAHVLYEKKAHPNSKLITVTNGVNKKRWQAKELFNRPKDITNEELFNIKNSLRSKTIAFVKEKTGISLNENVCTLVWARRFAMYKRPYLLFSDEERIIDILSNKDYPLQIIISGKPHEADMEGQKIMEKIIQLEKNPKIKGKLAYISGYSVGISEKLVSGADIWLNTPEEGKEACGTSGMKSALNGAIQMTVPDGWASEVNWNGIGYSLPGDDPRDTIYDLLENEVLPAFYYAVNEKEDKNNDLHSKWLSMSRGTIDLVEKNYTSERMLFDYIQKLYLL